MNRRFFLKSAAGALLAAPVLGSLRPEARADAASPRRNVFFHSPCGCLTNRWFPKVEHGALDADALSGTTLEVLAPFAGKLLVPRGLRAVNQYASPQTLDPHDQAMGSKLTCALLNADTPERYALSHSVDHAMARQVNPNGAAPLVLSVGQASTNVKWLLSYSGPNDPFPAITDPFAVYRSLSGVLVDAGTEAAYRLSRRQSMLDAVADDLESYRRLNMSSADRLRVEAWLDLVREVEIGLEPGICDLRRVGLTPEDIEAGRSQTPAEAFTAGADVMIGLVALSMLCDTNRSFILTFPGYVVFDWDGIHHERDHDSLAHRNGSGMVGGACVEGVLEQLRQIDRWYAEKFAKLVKLFDGLPEGEGTLLDSTATVWIQEFSDGNAKNLNNLPIVIAGSAGGYLRQGAVVNVEGAAIGPGNSEGSCQPGGDGVVGLDTGSERGNVPINKLYVTLMNALGCTAEDGGPVTQFGQFDGTVAEEGIRDPGELSVLRS